MSRPNKKQHLNQTSSKKKTPQKVSKKKAKGINKLKEVGKSCDNLISVLAEQGTLAIYLFDMFNMFAYLNTDTAETTPDKLNKLLTGIKLLNKYRNEILVKVIKITEFKQHVNELYTIVVNEEFFEERFIQVTTDIQKFMETSFDVASNLKEFWNLYKEELINSNVPEKFIIKVMIAADLSKQEILDFQNKRKSISEDKIDTSDLFDKNVESDPEDTVVLETNN